MEFLTQYIDKETFDKITLGTVFASGITVDSHRGIYIDGTGLILRFVAKKSDGDKSWACYVGLKDWTVEKICHSGTKVSVESLRNVMQVSEEVKGRYRH
jgi:hypothetical protein